LDPLKSTLRIVRVSAAEGIEAIQAKPGLLEPLKNASAARSMSEAAGVGLAESHSLLKTFVKRIEGYTKGCYDRGVFWPKGPGFGIYPA